MYLEQLQLESTADQGAPQICPSARQPSLLHPGRQLLPCHMLFTPGANVTFDLVAEKPARRSGKHTSHGTGVAKRWKRFRDRCQLAFVV